jgi:hypothetical protein
MLAVPEVVAVKLTEHVPAARVHGLPTNDPVTPLWVKVTVPVGVIIVKGDVSVTVAVHVVAWFTVTVEGEQTSVTIATLGLTVTLETPVLPL